MKKLFFLFAVAAMFCCTKANAQFTLIGYQASETSIRMWDSLSIPNIDRTKTYKFNWILVIKNSMNGAADLAAGDSLYLTMGLNGTDMIKGAVCLTNGLKLDSVSMLAISVKVPASMFVEGPYANVLSSKITGKYTNGTKTDIEDAYPFNGHFTVEFATTGIEEAYLENVRLYPNPVRNSLNIENANNLLVNIYAANGQLVKNVTANGNTTISVNDLSAGLYIVKMQSEKATRVEKIQVVR